MVRRLLWQQLGGFDERFFLYYEDVDLCLAARQAGWGVIYFVGAQAEHIGQGTTQAIKKRRRYYEMRSRIQYAAKRYGSGWGYLLASFILLFELPARGIYATTKFFRRGGYRILRAARRCKSPSM
jgi:GT2 family glycosyltransferase